MRSRHRSPPDPGSGASRCSSRNVNNTIYVEDDFVSTNHAMLTFRGRSWFVEDQGSTNGTYVNGHRIDRPVALSFGDELTIGRVRMRLER
jgi:pSer/pThr/pTyr-binding forkhead associated (FHA) protein